MTRQTTSSQRSARSGPSELVWKSTTVDNNGDVVVISNHQSTQQQQEPQQQASSPETPEEQPLEEYVPEGDSDERREQLAERCVRLMEEHRTKKESLALELGFTVEEVEAMCENHTPTLISTKKAISGWNLYVSENRSEELAAAKANGESPIQESIGERIKRYSNSYDAEARMLYTQKAEKHNLDTGLKGYVAPHDMTEKACELRLAYVKQACKRVSADLQSVKDTTGIEAILCFGFPSIPKDAKYLDFYQNKVIATELGHAFWARCDALQEGPKFSELQSRFDAFCKAHSRRSDYAPYMENYSPLEGNERDVSQQQQSRHRSKRQRTNDGPAYRMIKFIQDEVKRLYNEQAPNYGQIDGAIPWTNLSSNKDKYVTLESLPSGVSFAEPSKGLKAEERIMLGNALEKGQIKMKKRQIS